MRNYEATRAKIKNYLTALKERYSTNEWKDFEPHTLCREFGVSVTLPLLLKKGGYLFNENKKMMLSQKINNIDEVQAHTKILDYCNDSKHRIALRNAKKKEKAKIKADKLKKKKLAEEQKLSLENEKEAKANGVNINLPIEIYQLIQSYAETFKIDVIDFISLTFRELDNVIFNDSLYPIHQKLSKEPAIQENYKRILKELGTELELGPPPAQPSIEQIKENLRNDPEFRSSFNKNYQLPKKTAGRPKTPATLSDDPAYLEALRNAPSVPSTNLSIQNTDSSTEFDKLQSKIKSLESLVGLFTQGIISKQELETLKFGLLNK
jgi:hypothetical protein